MGGDDATSANDLGGLGHRVGGAEDEMPDDASWAEPVGVAELGTSGLRNTPSSENTGILRGLSGSEVGRGLGGKNARLKVPRSMSEFP